MARRTLAEYRLAVNHALGGAVSTGLDRDEIINDALAHLVTAHPWSWRRAGPILLSIPGPLALTALTYSEPAALPTLTGAAGTFSTYTFAYGDTLEVTGGTGVTTGVYRIAGKTSSTVITLSDDIGTPTPTDVAGTIYFPYINLPTDFGEEYSVTYPNSFSRQMIRTSMDHIQWLRASPVGDAFGFCFYYAVNSGQAAVPTAPTTQTGLTVPRLEIYPKPLAAVVNALQIVYLRNVPRLSDASDVPQIPTYMDNALDCLCRGMAQTFEDDDNESASMRQFERMLPTLKARDSSSQGRKGLMRGGLYPREGGLDPFYPTSIGDPTSV